MRKERHTEGGRRSKVDKEGEKQFEMYYELLVEWNEKMNLTAITEKSEVYMKHLPAYASLPSPGFHFYPRAINKGE